MLLMHFWKAPTSVAMVPAQGRDDDGFIRGLMKKARYGNRKRAAAYSFTAPVSEET
jgi:hypothetical protein